MDGAVAIDDEDVVEYGSPSGEDDFDAWVTDRAPSLLRFAYLTTGNRDAAEDAVQTALTRACEQWGRLRVLSDRDAYVRRMIVNAHVSWWRKFRRREVPVADVRVEVAAWAPDVATSVSNADLVWQLCVSLPTQQRASVVLRFYEDLSFRQIAELIGCSEATARSHVHRALAALRIRLEGHDKQENHDG